MYAAKLKSILGREQNFWFFIQRGFAIAKEVCAAVRTQNETKRLPAIKKLKKPSAQLIPEPIGSRTISHWVFNMPFSYFADLPNGATVNVFVYWPRVSL